MTESERLIGCNGRLIDNHRCQAPGYPLIERPEDLVWSTSAGIFTALAWGMLDGRQPYSGVRKWGPCSSLTQPGSPSGVDRS